MLVDQGFDTLRLGDSRNRDFQSALPSTRNAQLSHSENSLKKCLVKLNIPDVLMPNFRHGFRQNSTSQSSPIAGNRERGAFAFEPPKEKHHKPD
jgi:hypothetical protein